MRIFEEYPQELFRKYRMPDRWKMPATFLAEDAVPTVDFNVDIDNFMRFEIKAAALEWRYRNDGVSREHVVTVEVQEETKKARNKVQALSRMVTDKATTDAEKSNARRRIEEIQKKIKNLNDPGLIMNSVDRKKLFHDNMTVLCDGEYGTWKGRIYAYAKGYDEMDLIIRTAQNYADDYRGIPMGLPEMCW